MGQPLDLAARICTPTTAWVPRSLSLFASWFSLEQPLLPFNTSSTQAERMTRRVRSHPASTRGGFVRLHHRESLDPLIGFNVA